METAKKLISPRLLAEQSAYLECIYHPYQLPFIVEVKSRLQDGRYRLKNYDCPCGGKKEDIIISEVDRYGLPLNSVVCMRCGTVRTDPYLDESSLEDFYTNFYQQMYGRAMELDSYFLRQKSYGEKVLSVSQGFLKPESWVFEVGCGAGGALKVFQEQGYRVAGCDYSNELIDGGRQKRVENIYCGSLNDVGNNLKIIKFDLIYLHHVFEHLNDPLLFLKNCRKYLGSSGKIIIVIPDINRIDEYRFPSGNLLLYLHIAHKYNFSFEGLQRLGRRAGYSVLRLKPEHKMKTPCSDSSELWVQMMIETDVSLVEKISKPKDKNVGVDMLRYLERTEKLYSLGLCKGQVLTKIELISVLMKRVLRKIKNLVISKFCRLETPNIKT